MQRPLRLAATAFTILLVLAAGAAALWWFVVVPEVTVARPVRGPAVMAVYATGTVEPVNWAKVAPLVKGRIVELCKCESEPVETGAVLGRLDDEEARAELRQYEADARFLADEVARKKALVDKALVSRQAYDQALSAYRQAEAVVAAAKERLDRYLLRAPIDGIVLRRDGEVGEVVDSGEVVFWVGQPKPLRITAEVDEEDIARVKLAQQTLIKADAFPGQVFYGRVDEITPKGDPVNKSYRVRIALPDEAPLMIGMTTEINIVIEEKADALLVPRGAVVEGKVWLAEGGRAVPRAVEVGIEGMAMTEIIDGLTQGARVIVDPPQTLEPGARVRMIGDAADGLTP